MKKLIALNILVYLFFGLAWYLYADRSPKNIGTSPNTTIVNDPSIGAQFNDEIVEFSRARIEYSPLEGYSIFDQPDIPFTYYFPQGGAVQVADIKTRTRLVITGPTQIGGQELSDGLIVNINYFNSDLPINRAVQQRQQENLFSTQLTKGLDLYDSNDQLGLYYSARGTEQTDNIYLTNGEGTFVEIVPIIKDPNGRGYQAIIDEVIRSIRFK